MISGLKMMEQGIIRVKANLSQKHSDTMKTEKQLFVALPVWKINWSFLNINPSTNYRITDEYKHEQGGHEKSIM